MSLVATLRKGDGPTLGYLSHVDTVLADAEDWTADPWGGEIRDGFLYGRGAVDMKNQTAAEAVAAVHLARSGAKFNGTLKVISVADEETGGALGAKWLTEERPDLSRVDYLLNEGGGAVMPYGDRRLYGVCVAEKGTFRFNVKTTGTAAHASVPIPSRNALLKLAPLIVKLGEGRPSFDLTEATEALLEALGEDPADPAQALENVRAIEPRARPAARRRDERHLRPDARQRGLEDQRHPGAGPGARRLPRPAGAGRGRRRSSGSARCSATDGYELEFTEAIAGNRSPVQSKLMDAIGDWVGEHDPGASAVPFVLPAFTDCRWWRAAFPDCVAYGFLPMRHQTIYEWWPLMHARRRAHRRPRPRLRRRLLPRPPREAPCRFLKTSSASAGWRCATGCSSTGRRSGRPPCAPRTAR